MVRRRLTAAAAAAAALALVLSGCFGDDDEEPLSALTPVERTVQTNPDRDPKDVEHKAAAVDPCALLRAGDDTADPAPISDPWAAGPHSCWTGNGSVRVDSYTSLSENQRFRLARLEVAGAVGYRTDLDHSSCLIHLPISHDHAISFSGSSRCRVITAYAEAAAELLQQRPRQATRPRGIGRVSACALVTEAGRKPSTDSGGTTYTMLDRCHVENSPIDLQLEYDDTVVRDYQTAHRVGDTTVRAQQSDDRCYLHVPLGPADVAVREGHVLSGWITTATCKQGLAFARRLVPAAARITASDRAPERLLHAWEEPDTSAVGACVDIADQADLECTPAEDAEVPDRRADLIEHAEADPNVLCAAATPIVRQHYGDTFTAVTALASRSPAGSDARDDTTQCAFGAPDHTFEISIVLSTARLGTDADDDVAGQPARVRPTQFDPSTASTSYAVARDEPDQPGFLSVELTAWPARGTGIYQTSGRQVEPDPTRIEAADAFVADLADALL